MTKPKQLEMFPDMPTVTTAKRRDVRWYYLVSPTGRDMLALEEGKHIWIEHDPTNLAPYCFSSAAAAHKFIRRNAIKAQVKLWPWQETKPANWRRNLATKSAK